MLPPISHFPVNWIDGMKISKRHFVETENFFTDHLRDALAANLTNFNYGLLPTEAANQKSLELYVNCDYTQQINVRLVNCRAVTSHGYRVEIVRSDRMSLNTSYSQILSQFNMQAVKEDVLYVTVSVNPFARVPIGEPSLEENPPRHPFASAEYRLNVVPQSMINTAEFGASHFIIGKIVYSGGQLSPVSNYIPACSNVNSFHGLVNWYYNFANLLGDLETNMLKIIQKIKLKSQDTSLTRSVHFLVEKLLFSMAQGIVAFKWVIPQQPPIFMIEFMLQYAQTMKTAIGFLTDKEKEELLSYFAEWSGLLPGVIENKLDSMLNLKYNHQEVAQILAVVDEFFRPIGELFSKLSQIDFIGKRKGGNEIFIIENPVADTTSPTPPPADQPKKNRWSPMG
ncbi:MAG: hypothetical protein MUC97_18610 [Bernardetiaceae bacterium]|nr:hypothetical protein [Bernardetiaceae bacterium]